MNNFLFLPYDLLQARCSLNYLMSQLTFNPSQTLVIFENDDLLTSSRKSTQLLLDCTADEFMGKFQKNVDNAKNIPGEFQKIKGLIKEAKKTIHGWAKNKKSESTLVKSKLAEISIELLKKWNLWDDNDPPEKKIIACIITTKSFIKTCFDNEISIYPELYDEGDWEEVEMLCMAGCRKFLSSIIAAAVTGGTVFIGGLCLGGTLATSAIGGGISGIVVGIFSYYYLKHQKEAEEEKVLTAKKRILSEVKKRNNQEIKKYKPKLMA